MSLKLSANAADLFGVDNRKDARGVVGAGKFVL